MPEDKFKQKLRRTKLRVITTLTSPPYGYERWQISTFDSGPFDISAGKRHIRIVFDYATTEDINLVRLADFPRGCIREIWQFNKNARRPIVCKVTPPKKPVKRGCLHQ